MYSKSILSNLHFYREITEKNLTTIDSIITLLESDLILEDKFWKGNIGTCSKCLRDELKEHLETHVHCSRCEEEEEERKNPSH